MKLLIYNLIGIIETLYKSLPNYYPKVIQLLELTQLDILYSEIVNGTKNEI